MAGGLSYQSLRCVLEYLEANERIHITARSPQLQAIDKSIPLRLSLLRIDDDRIQVNNITYHLDSTFRSDENSQIEFRCGQSKLRIEVPKGVENYKKLTSTLLAHKDIYTNMLRFDAFDERTLKNGFSLNFSVRTRELFSFYPNVNNCLSMVHPDSIPLKRSIFRWIDGNELKHPVLASAEQIDVYHVPTVPQLRALSNKNIKLKGLLPMDVDCFLELVGFWIQDRREIGSNFEMGSLELHAIRLFKEIEKQYKVIVYRRRVVVPIDKKTKLHICENRGNQEKTIRMEVMKIGSTASNSLKRKHDN